jgi:hypothetical protein
VEGGPTQPLPGGTLLMRHDEDRRVERRILRPRLSPWPDSHSPENDPGRVTRMVRVRIALTGVLPGRAHLGITERSLDHQFCVRKLSAGECEMGNAAGRGRCFNCEALLEFLEIVPKAFPASQNNGHDSDVHVVN